MPKECELNNAEVLFKLFCRSSRLWRMREEDWNLWGQQNTSRVCALWWKSRVRRSGMNSPNERWGQLVGIGSTAAGSNVMVRKVHLFEREGRWELEIKCSVIQMSLPNPMPVQQDLPQDRITTLLEQQGNMLTGGRSGELGEFEVGWSTQLLCDLNQQPKTLGKILFFAGKGRAGLSALESPRRACRLDC